MHANWSEHSTVQKKKKTLIIRRVDMHNKDHLACNEFESLGIKTVHFHYFVLHKFIDAQMVVQILGDCINHFYVIYFTSLYYFVFA